MNVEHQQELRLPRIERRKERNPILSIQQYVAISHVPRIHKRRRRINGELAPSPVDLYPVNEVVRFCAGKPGREPFDTVARFNPATRLPVQVLLGTAGFGMAHIPPIEYSDYQSC